MKALVGIIMGSTSDWETMAGAADTLTQLGVGFETRVVSAHRTLICCLNMPRVPQAVASKF